LVRLLEWDGQDAANLLQSCRLPVFEEVEEGLDRRQPDVARDGRILARILEVLEEGADEAGIDNVSSDGRTFSLSAANTKSSWKLAA
jgi:hypothetical protein